jgi:hypothetical protein
MAIAWVVDEQQDRLQGVDTSTWLRPPEVWARYAWNDFGDCFKCEKSGLPVAVVGSSIWASGEASDLTMCHSCVYRLYLMHVRQGYALPKLRVRKILVYDQYV